MNYLLIEDRAWVHLQVHSHRLTNIMRQFNHHFNPTGESD